MTIGEKIRYIRFLRLMTQKELGIAIGLNEKNADVRISQYESDSRKPKEKLIKKIAYALEVCPEALTTPHIEGGIGLAHTFFALENHCGLRISNNDGVLTLTLDNKNNEYQTIFDIWSAWNKESEKLSKGEITEDEYNAWRYTYEG